MEDLQENHRAIVCKWVFNVNRDKYGQIERLKAYPYNQSGSGSLSLILVYVDDMPISKKGICSGSNRVSQSLSNIWTKAH